MCCLERWTCQRTDERQAANFVTEVRNRFHWFLLRNWRISSLYFIVQLWHANGHCHWSSERHLVQRKRFDASAFIVDNDYTDAYSHNSVNFSAWLIWIDFFYQWITWAQHHSATVLRICIARGTVVFIQLTLDRSVNQSIISPYVAWLLQGWKCARCLCLSWTLSQVCRWYSLSARRALKQVVTLRYSS